MPSPLLGASGKGSGNKKMPRFVWSLKHRELLRRVLVSVKSVLDKSRYMYMYICMLNSHQYIIDTVLAHILCVYILSFYISHIYTCISLILL